jgi:hypothetical protein
MTLGRVLASIRQQFSSQGPTDRTEENLTQVKVISCGIVRGEFIIYRQFEVIGLKKTVLGEELIAGRAGGEELIVEHRGRYPMYGDMVFLRRLSSGALVFE